QDEADLRRLAQRIEDREVLRPGNAENVLDAFPQQRVDQRTGAGGGFRLGRFWSVHLEAPRVGNWWRLCLAVFREKRFHRVYESGRIVERDVVVAARDFGELRLRT